jgi:hypothetical protein
MGHAFTRRGSLWVGLLCPLFGRFIAARRGLIWNLGAGFSGLICVIAFRVNGWRVNDWRVNDWRVNDWRVNERSRTPGVFGWAGLYGALVSVIVHPARQLLALWLRRTCAKPVMVHVFVVAGIGGSGAPSVFGRTGLLWALVPGVVDPAGALLAPLVLFGLACTESVMVYVFVVIENRTIWIRGRWGEWSRDRGRDGSRDGIRAWSREWSQDRRLLAHGYFSTCYAAYANEACNQPRQESREQNRFPPSASKALRKMTYARCIDGLACGCCHGEEHRYQ